GLSTALWPIADIPQEVIESHDSHAAGSGLILNIFVKAGDLEARLNLVGVRKLGDLGNRPNDDEFRPGRDVRFRIIREFALDAQKSTFVDLIVDPATDGLDQATQTATVVDAIAVKVHHSDKGVSLVAFEAAEFPAVACRVLLSRSGP